MTAKPKPRPKTRNPLYRGATPQDVGRALLKHKPNMTTALTAAELRKQLNLPDDARYARWPSERGSIRLTVPAGDYLSVACFGPESASVEVCGPGNGDAIRDGGSGYAIRTGSGSGSSYRFGSGHGSAIRDGSGAGTAVRRSSGSGPGHYKRARNP